MFSLSYVTMAKITLTFLFCTLILGCSNRLQVPDSKSGFLEDYHLFKPNPYNENSWVRTSRGFKLNDLSNYQAIAVAPIEVWLKSNTPYQIKDENKQQRLTAYFEQQIKAKVGDKFQIVPPGTKKSLLVKIAITNIEERAPEMEALDILPFRIVMNAGESAYLLATDQKAIIGNASIEAELVDSDSGKGLVAIIVNNTSGEINVADNETNIDSIKAIVDDWVNKLVNAINNKPPN